MEETERQSSSRRGLWERSARRTGTSRHWRLAVQRQGGGEVTLNTRVCRSWAVAIWPLEKHHHGHHHHHRHDHHHHRREEIAVGVVGPTPLFLLEPCGPKIRCSWYYILLACHWPVFLNGFRNTQEKAIVKVLNLILNYKKFIINSKKIKQNYNNIIIHNIKKY